MKKWIYIIVMQLIFMGIYAQGKQIKIIIDPGHGGDDPGHLSRQEHLMNEKDLNLLISQKLGTYLNKQLQNVDVQFTRTVDQNVSLDQRVLLANQQKAHYFLSIHCNGSDNPQAVGTESHIHDKSQKLQYEWAEEIEKEFKTRALRNSRGVKDSADRKQSLQVTKYTEMPSVLVECGFLTNEAEAKYLNSAYGQDIIASALFRAIRTIILKQHPEFSILKDEQPIESARIGIQILISKEDMNTDDVRFKKVRKPVQKIIIPENLAYPYRYVVGPFKNEKEARQFLKKLRRRGYTDAFITLM